jgi:hypothetical protein
MRQINDRIKIEKQETRQGGKSVKIMLTGAVVGE